MHDSELTARSVYLIEMLRQAGLDAEARDVAERIQRVLTDELHHRMKNMLAMVAAIVRQTMRTAGQSARCGSRYRCAAGGYGQGPWSSFEGGLESTGLLAVLKSAVAQHDTAAGRIAVTGSSCRSLRLPSCR